MAVVIPIMWIARHWTSVSQSTGSEDRKATITITDHNAKPSPGEYKPVTQLFSLLSLLFWIEIFL